MNQYIYGLSDPWSESRRAAQPKNYKRPERGYVKDVEGRANLNG